jgi:hypothetical protein
MTRGVSSRSASRVIYAALLTLVMSASAPASARAADRYALVVSGASGGQEFAIRYNFWRASLVSVLRGRFGYALDHLVELGDDPENEPAVGKSTSENVASALADFHRRMTRDDVLVVILIGHGTATDSDDARFNLVGADLTAAEWSALVAPIPGRVVFINAASGSFPFLSKLAARGRIVMTATDALAQQTETVLPEFLFAAFLAAESDTDKNGKVSVWEAFTYASRQVKDWFQQAGQLQTERPLLDDTGAGIGREAGAPGADGTLAQATYFDSDQAATPVDPASLVLLKRRGELESQMEALKARKADVPAAEYDAELERILLEIATITRQLRSR